jgi:hypothetical protein
MLVGDENRPEEVESELGVFGFGLLRVFILRI